MTKVGQNLEIGLRETHNTNNGTKIKSGVPNLSLFGIPGKLCNTLRFEQKQSRSASPSVASENNDNLLEVEAQNLYSGDYNDGSLSSMNSVKTDPNLVHHDTDSIEPDLDDANKVKKAYKSGIGGKNKSSYAVSSSKFSKGEQNLSQVGLSEGQERFRFISQTPTGRRNSNTTMGSNHENIKDSSEITWSQNSDRLI